MSNLSNPDFLSSYLEGSDVERAKLVAHVILPFEVVLIGNRISHIEQRKNEIALERAAIAEQSGDSWHDGAFRESDKEVLHVEGEERRLKDRLKSSVVQYPDDSETRATLGSRIVLRNGAKDTRIDIVGFSAIHDKKSADAMPASLDAPVVQQIIGKMTGEVTTLNVGGSSRELEIIAIDQNALRINHEVSGNS